MHGMNIQVKYTLIMLCGISNIKTTVCSTNCLHPSRFFMYHHVWQSEVLHGPHSAFACFVWISKQSLFPYYSINWLVIYMRIIHFNANNYKVKWICSHYVTLVPSNSIIGTYSNQNKSTPHTFYLFKIRFNIIMIVVNTVKTLNNFHAQYNNNNNNNYYYYLTAIGISPGGSGFEHIYKYLTLCY